MINVRKKLSINQKKIIKFLKEEYKVATIKEIAYYVYDCKKQYLRPSDSQKNSIRRTVRILENKPWKLLKSKILKQYKGQRKKVQKIPIKPSYVSPHVQIKYFKNYKREFRPLLIKLVCLKEDYKKIDFEKLREEFFKI